MEKHPKSNRVLPSRRKTIKTKQNKNTKDTKTVCLQEIIVYIAVHKLAHVKYKNIY